MLLFGLTIRANCNNRLIIMSVHRNYYICIFVTNSSNHGHFCNYRPQNLCDMAFMVHFRPMVPWALVVKPSLSLSFSLSLFFSASLFLCLYLSSSLFFGSIFVCLFSSLSFRLFSLFFFSIRLILCISHGQSVTLCIFCAKCVEFALEFVTIPSKHAANRYDTSRHTNRHTHHLLLHKYLIRIFIRFMHVMNNTSIQSLTHRPAAQRAPRATRKIMFNLFLLVLLSFGVLCLRFTQPRKT